VLYRLPEHAQHTANKPYKLTIQTIFHPISAGWRASCRADTVFPFLSTICQGAIPCRLAQFKGAPRAAHRAVRAPQPDCI